MSVVSIISPSCRETSFPLMHAYIHTHTQSVSQSQDGADEEKNIVFLGGTYLSFSSLQMHRQEQ